MCVMNLLDYLGSECNEPTGLSRAECNEPTGLSRSMSVMNLLDYLGL